MGVEWLKWIKLVMTDGDMNEIVELEKVFHAQIFPAVMWIAYHIQSMEEKLQLGWSGIKSI